MSHLSSCLFTNVLLHRQRVWLLGAHRWPQPIGDIVLAGGADVPPWHPDVHPAPVYASEITRTLPLLSVLMQRYVPQHRVHSLLDDAFSVFYTLWRHRIEGAQVNVSATTTSPIQVVAVDHPLHHALGITNRTWPSEDMMATVWGAPLLFLDRQPESEAWFAPALVVGTTMGFTGFDARDYTSPGWQDGAWRAFRAFLYARYGVREEEVTSDAIAVTHNIPPPPRPCRVLFLHSERRPLEHESSVIEAARSTSVGAGCTFRNMSWADMPGLADQLELMRDTDITMSSVGSTALNVFMLRPGSVHVSLGRQDGLLGFMEDFFYPALSWVRTLYMWPNYVAPPPKKVGALLAGAIDVWRAITATHDSAVTIVHHPDDNRSPVNRIVGAYLRQHSGAEAALRKGTCMLFGDAFIQTGCHPKDERAMHAITDAMPLAARPSADTVRVLSISWHPAPTMDLEEVWARHVGPRLGVKFEFHSVCYGPYCSYAGTCPGAGGVHVPVLDAARARNGCPYPHHTWEEFYAATNGGQMLEADAFLCTGPMDLCGAFMAFGKPMVMVSYTHPCPPWEAGPYQGDWADNVHRVVGAGFGAVLTNNAYYERDLRTCLGPDHTNVVTPYILSTGTYAKGAWGGWPTCAKAWTEVGARPLLWQRYPNVNPACGIGGDTPLGRELGELSDGLAAMGCGPLQSVSIRFAGHAYTFTELANTTALAVVLPWTHSFMSAFEIWSMGIPMFMPSRAMILRHQASGACLLPDTDGFFLDHLDALEMPGITFFDNAEHLLALLADNDLRDLSRAQLAASSANVATATTRWAGVLSKLLDHVPPPASRTWEEAMRRLWPGFDVKGYLNKKRWPETACGNATLPITMSSNT